MKEPAWLRNTGKHTAIVVHIIVIQLAITVCCTVQSTVVYAPRHD